MKSMTELKKPLMKLGTTTYNNVINALDSVNPSPLHRRILLSCITVAQASSYSLKGFVAIFKFAKTCLILHNTVGKLPNRLKTKDIIFTVPVCPKCNQSKEREITFWDLYSESIPVCPKCDENIRISDNVTIRKGG